MISGRNHCHIILLGINICQDPKAGPAGPNNDHSGTNGARCPRCRHGKTAGLRVDAWAAWGCCRCCGRGRGRGLRRVIGEGAAQGAPAQAAQAQGAHGAQATGQHGRGTEGPSKCHVDLPSATWSDCVSVF